MAQTSSQQLCAWQGPAIFSFGFRPFFLFGAVWVMAAMLLWLAGMAGVIELPTRFDPVSWHAHEFLFGYLGAFLAGFLLTAVPNWTGRLPLVGWPLAGLFALVAFGVAHFARLARWQGHRTLSDPLVWVLHAAYAFVPLGGFALGLDQLFGNTGTAGAQHLWMLGAIGAMTLAVMTRATLGHTGQALAANRATVLIYACVFASALARLCAPLWLEASYLAGALWIAAFAGYVGAYGPSLLFAASGKKK